MSTLRNKVQLIGNLGQDPEIIHFENGDKLVKVRIATNETYRDEKGEKVETTQWHNAVARGKQADIIEAYTKKGQEIGIDGKLIHRSFESKTGEKRIATEVQIGSVILLGKKD